MRHVTTAWRARNNAKRTRRTWKVSSRLRIFLGGPLQFGGTSGPDTTTLFTLEDTFMGSKTVTRGASLPLALIVMTLLSTGIATGQAPPATAVSGSDLFYNSCASCHGTDGKGNGPLGQVLTVRPADLTIIAKKTGGVFPAAKIYELIDGRNPAVRGHGGPDMPVWGDVFAARGGTASVKNRINALVKYIETLQVK
jgi:mono/diheme cytochrome c family protein